MTIYKGIDWTYRLTATIKGTTTRQNLTGVPLSFVIKRDAASPALVTLTVGNGITLLAQSGDTEGQADLLIADVVTAALEAGPHQCTLIGTIDGFERLIIPPTKIPVRAL